MLAIIWLKPHRKPQSRSQLSSIYNFERSNIFCFKIQFCDSLLGNKRTRTINSTHDYSGADSWEDHKYLWCIHLDASTLQEMLEFNPFQLLISTMICQVIKRTLGDKRISMNWKQEHALYKNTIIYM